MYGYAKSLETEDYYGFNEDGYEEESDADDYEEDEDIATCEKCGNICDINDTTLFDDMVLCEDCLDDYTFVCGDCGTRYWKDNSYHYGDLNICESCYEDGYTTCDDCGCTILNDDAYYDNDDEYRENPYCYNCHEKRRDKHIRDYNYKPDPIFYGTGIFYGVELEIDGGGKDNDNAETVLNIANTDEETRLYCKHDGSLDNGFEMVSHPMSLDYHVNHMAWRQILSSCSRMSYKSHDTDTAGLHVHVGRNELGCNDVEREDTIARIVFFIEKHWNNMLRFSRRTEAQMNRWAARYGCKDTPKDTLKHAKDNYRRYVCLNLLNYSTIEFRIFRGTLRYPSFIAVLQMVDTICNAAISMSDEEFQDMTWESFVRSIDASAKPELVNFLNEKRLYSIKPVNESILKGDK